MKKVIRLTEADLTRIVRRVIKETKYGSFDEKDWADDSDRIMHYSDGFDNMEYDEEEFDDFDEFTSKHPDQPWFGKGEDGKKRFGHYKDHFKKPFKVRTRRD